MVLRFDKVEQMSAYAFGAPSSNPSVLVGQKLLREAIDLLHHTVHRHARDLEMTRTAGWHKVNGEYSHEAEHRLAHLIATEKFLVELKGRSR